MSQHEVIKVQPLLDEHGHVAEPGWAKDLVWQYDRSAIKVPKYRITSINKLTQTAHHVSLRPWHRNIYH